MRTASNAIVYHYYMELILMYSRWRLHNSYYFHLYVRQTIKFLMTRLSVCSLGVSCNEMIDTPMLLVVTLNLTQNLALTLNLTLTLKLTLNITLNLTPYLTLKLTITLLSEFQNRTHPRNIIFEFDSFERTRVILFLNSISNFFYIKT